MSQISNQIWIAFLDGSSNGAAIQLTGTVIGAATLLHTATSDLSTIDEVWIYGFNSSGSDAVATIAFGGTGGKDRVTSTVANGAPPKCIVPGWRLAGGLPIFGFGSIAGAISIYGSVNRILKVVS